MTATLVLGGARSGKSRHAESLVRTAGPAPWTYIATAQAFDDEMADRIARHRTDRAGGWETVDAPHDLPDAIRRLSGAGRPVLVDCLTLWLSNRLLADADLDFETQAIVDAAERFDGTLVLVSNEVGFSIVPDNALARRFRDAQGRLNQKVADIADRVVLVVAGYPIAVKG